MSAAASETFDKILDYVKKSNLNFCLQLSPFSANISLKKTFVKNKAGVYLNPPVSTVPVIDSLVQKNKHLEEKVKNLETIIDDINLRLKVNEEIENKVKIEKIETGQADLLKELQKHHLEKKVHQDHVTSLQTLIQERDKEVQNLQIRLEKSECVVKRLNKLVNANKMNHEKETKLITKNLKSEIKSWKKELGSERSKRIKAEKNIATLEIIVNELNTKSVKSISCQTSHCPEVPYLVTTSLPPIFGSQLCRISKPINYLSRSLPDMDTLSWVKVTEEDNVLNAAEEALNEQYDKEVEDYYKEAKIQAEAVRQIFEENAIGKLFEQEK